MPAYLPYAIALLIAAALLGMLALYAAWRRAVNSAVSWARSTLVDQMSDGVIVLDSRNRIVHVNPAAESMLGRLASQLVGWPPDQWGPSFPELHRLCLQPPAPGAGPTGAVLQRYGERDYEAKILALTDSRGRKTGQIVVLHDVAESKRAEEALRAEKQLFENLVKVAQTVTESPTMEGTLQNILDVATSLTGAERGNLLIFGGAGDVIHSLLARETASELGVPRTRQYSIVQQVIERGLAGWVIKHRQPVLIADATQDPRWLTLPGETHVARSVLSLPIMEGDGLLGVLTLVHSQAGFLHHDHLRLMQAAASQMILAVRNAQMFDAERRLADQQAMLYEVLRTAGSQLDPALVIDEAVRAISHFAGWPSVAVIIPDPRGERWIVQAASGLTETAVGFSAPLNQGIVGRTLTTGQPQYVPDVRQDPDYVAGEADGDKARSKLAVPIRRGDRLLGVLDVESDQVNAFNQNDMLLAESLADTVGLALENARLYRAIADERGRLQALIKSSRDGVMLIGMDGRVLVFNTTAHTMLALSGQADDWLDRPVTEALAPLRHTSPLAVQALVKETRRVRSGDETAGEGEFEVSPRKIHWLNLPVMAGPAPLGRLLVFRDVTEERLLGKVRDDLTHTMVHDLRNPLGAIFSALIMLRSDESLDLLQREVVEIAVASVRHLMALVNSILDIARLENAEVPLKLHPASLAALADELAQEQKSLLADKSLALQSDVPADLPLVNVDLDLIRRVLQNLIGNAIKFTPPGGRVLLRAAANGINARQLTVAVQDTGPGIPDGLKDRLFQKFVTGRKKESGNGLGLAFCKLAVERHGGHIWVESEPGQGATFYFTLPVAPPN
jgi:PAS domain S-box-containing protein